MNNKFISDSANINYKTHFFIILSTLFIVCCASSELRVSEFKFRYNEQNYIVRSAYCLGNPKSCNHLIGEEFIAVDMNQDRLIDKIDKGDISIGEAQKIYDYCLELLAKQNKLSEINKSNDNFSIDNMNYKFEIKSFFPELGEPFNEFTVTDKRDGWKYKISVLLDENADGKLDEVLKGKISIEEAQKHYDLAIAEGLADSKLRKINDSILIK